MIVKVTCFSFKRGVFQVVVSENRLERLKTCCTVLSRSQVRLPLKEQAAFFEFIQLYFKSNRNLYYLIREYSKICRKKYQDIFRQIAYLLQTGRALSSIFSESSLIHKGLILYFTIAEETGEDLFGRVQNELKQQVEFRKMLAQKMGYPLFLCGLVFVVGQIFDASMLPQLKQLYQMHELDLPIFLQIFSFRLSSIIVALVVAIIAGAVMVLTHWFPLLLLSVPIVRGFFLLDFQKQLFMIWLMAIQYNRSIDRLLDIVLSKERMPVRKYLLSTVSYGFKQGKPVKDVMNNACIEQRYKSLFAMEDVSEKMEGLFEVFIDELTSRQKQWWTVFSQSLNIFIIVFISVVVFIIGYLMLSPLTVMIEAI